MDRDRSTSSSLTGFWQAKVRGREGLGEQAVSKSAFQRTKTALSLAWHCRGKKESRRRLPSVGYAIRCRSKAEFHRRPARNPKEVKDGVVEGTATTQWTRVHQKIALQEPSEGGRFGKPSEHPSLRSREGRGEKSSDRFEIGRKENF